MTDHFVNKSDTPEADKDLWQTPVDLFNNLNDEFNFELDVCASIKNNLCVNYFCEHLSALNNEWNHYGEIRAAFINPPYSQTSTFLNRSAQQAKEHNINVVALVNANTDTKWFKEAAETANEIRLITGRVGFVRADGKKANGNTKGQCLIIWRGTCKTPCNITLINGPIK